MKKLFYPIILSLAFLQCKDSTPPIPPTYTLNFDTLDGSEIASQTIQADQMAEVPVNNPSREAYAFKGWYKDKKFIREFKFEKERINSDLTVYAKWEALKFVVTFDSNGGSDIPNITLIGESSVTDLESPIKANFDFKGWYRDASLTQVFDSQNNKVLGDMTLYAKWESSVYNIIFITDGGSQVPSQMVNRDNFAQRPSTDPTKEGLVFIDWYADDLFKVRFDFDKNVITEETKIYAKWTDQAFEVSFEPNGGAPIEKLKVAGNEPLKEVPTPVRDGFNFGGWYFDEGLEILYRFGVGNVDADFRLYAKWLSSEKEINSFSFQVSKNSNKISSDITGRIDDNLVEIEVPPNTDLTALTPTVTISGKSIVHVFNNKTIDPNLEPHDFSNSITYVVTAEDGSTKAFSINAYDPSSKDISSFSFLSSINSNLNSDFSVQNPTTSFPIDLGASPIDALIATVSHSGNSYTISDSNGKVYPDNKPIDFSKNLIIYTITAHDNSTRDYHVIVKNNSSKNIHAFFFLKSDNPSLNEDVQSTINGNKINVIVPDNVQRNNLKALIFQNGNSYSPTNVTDFSSPVTYTVTATDGSVRQFVVDVSSQSQAKEITSFVLKKSSNPSLTEDIKGRIVFVNNVYSIELDIPVCLNINRKNLVPTIAINGQTVSPPSMTKIDLSNAVEYTVTAADNSQRIYNISLDNSSNYQNMNITAVNDILDRADIRPSKINYIHVDIDAPTENCGTDWDHALSGAELSSFIKSIADASMSNYYVVLLKGGYYTPGSERSSSFSMKNNIALIGGWDGTDEYRLDTKANLTILSGSIGTTTQVNTYHTFKNVVVDSSALLYGVVVSGGVADGGNENSKGAGMFNESSSPIIMNVTFSGNLSDNAGAGMYNSKTSSPLLINVSFEQNSAYNWSGGGMYNSENTSVVMENVSFLNNRALYEGGGIYNESNSNILVINGTFYNNSANMGGGIYSLENSTKVINCTFNKNEATSTGGGLFAQNSDVMSVNSIFWNNIGVQLVSEGNRSNLTFKNSIDQSSENPLLQSLRNNGGYLKTIAIIAESPAIDQGLYIQKSGNVLFFSQDNSSWFSDPDLSSTAVLPPNSEDITSKDARDFNVNNQRDLGAFDLGASN